MDLQSVCCNFQKVLQSYSNLQLIHHYSFELSWMGINYREKIVVFYYFLTNLTIAAISHQILSRYSFLPQIRFHVLSYLKSLAVNQCHSQTNPALCFSNRFIHPKNHQELVIHSPDVHQSRLIYRDNSSESPLTIVVKRRKL